MGVIHRHPSMDLTDFNCSYLKLVPAFFYQIFNFSPNDSPLETMRNFFYFILKALFVPKIFKFL